MSEFDEVHTNEGEPDPSGGKFALVVEISKEGDFRSRKEALAALRSMRASIEDDSAFSAYDIGRGGLRRLD